MSTPPRVWLGRRGLAFHDPADRPTVRDNHMHVWTPATNGTYRTADGRHLATWGELRARFDLVEVPETVGVTPQPAAALHD